MRETRVGHFRKDPCDVYVGRGSAWGNPFVRRGRAGASRYAVRETDDPIAEYEAYVRRSPDLMGRLGELRGKVLGCFCVRLEDGRPPAGRERCHAQVLARLADQVPAASGEGW